MRIDELDFQDLEARVDQALCRVNDIMEQRIVDRFWSTLFRILVAVYIVVDMLR